MKKIVFCLTAIVLFFSACREENNQTPEETITTVRLQVTNAAGFNQEFLYNDPDGDGGNAPTVTNIDLAPNTTYDMSVYFEDRSKSPLEDVTEEVKSENTDHLVVFKSKNGTLTTTYSDQDDNGKPLGLKVKLATAGVATDTLTVILHHEPDTKDNLANPGGSIDVEVKFPVRVK